MKTVIFFISVLICLKAESQNTNLQGEYKYFYMDSITDIANSGKGGLWDIYAFDTSKFYGFKLIIGNPSFQKRDVNTYNKLIKSAERSNPKQFYFLFEKNDEYHPDSSDIKEGRRNLLVIHQRDLTGYLETLEILNPKFKKDFSKNKVQIVRYKYHDRMWHLKQSL